MTKSSARCCAVSTKPYHHKTIDTKEIESYISQQGGFDFSKVFDQYLRTIQIPVLEYKTSGSMISYRWTNCVRRIQFTSKGQARRATNKEGDQTYHRMAV